jgi:hypothetical protein
LKIFPIRPRINTGIGIYRLNCVVTLVRAAAAASDILMNVLNENYSILYISLENIRFPFHLIFLEIERDFICMIKLFHA